MYFEINLCVTYRHGISKSAGLKLLLQLHKVQTNVRYSTLLSTTCLPNFLAYRYLWVVCTILVPLFKIFWKCRAQWVAVITRMFFGSKLSKFWAYLTTTTRSQNSRAITKTTTQIQKKCKYIYAYTPETDRYFVDGNSKTQQKNLLTTCKQFFLEMLAWKLKRLVYVPKFRN